jgi:hypothetical protein
MPPLDYLTVDELKSRFPSNQFDGAMDVVLAAAIKTASRQIDTFLKRKPGAFAVNADVTRYFKGSGTSQLWIDELAALPTTVAVAEAGQVDNASGSGGTYTTWTANDYVCWPQNALDEGMPFHRLDILLLSGLTTKSIWYGYPRAVKIVGRFGFSTSVPEEIKTATEIQAVRLWKRQQQAYSDVGAITELKQLRYVKELDPMVAAILNTPKFATSIL